MKTVKDMLHSIESFGIKKVTMSGIRVEKIPLRIKPAVPFPHKHDFYQIMLVTKGQGSHQIDFKKYDLTAGQVYVMKPGQVHSWKLSKGIDGFIIEFNRDALKTNGPGEAELYSLIELLPDLIELKRTQFEKSLISLAEVMHEEFSSKQEFQDLCLQKYLSGFMIQLLREGMELKLDHKKNVSNLERFRTLVEENFRTEHRVEFYAKKLGVGAKALTMQLTRGFGKSPRALIQERFILEAKRLLAFSNLSVAEIGYELGFQDANYFTRAFRLHVKMAPGEFRKKVKITTNAE